MDYETSETETKQSQRDETAASETSSIKRERSDSITSEKKYKKHQDYNDNEQQQEPPIKKIKKPRKKRKVLMGEMEEGIPSNEHLLPAHRRSNGRGSDKVLKKGKKKKVCSCSRSC